MSTSPATQRTLTLVRLVFHLTLAGALLAISLMLHASNRRLAQDDLDFAQRLKAHQEFVEAHARRMEMLDQRLREHRQALEEPQRRMDRQHPKPEQED